MKNTLLICIPLILSGYFVGCSPRKALNNAEGAIQVTEMNQEEKSEVAKAGSLLVDGVIIEMAEMGYSNALAESVKEEATIEITLAHALIIQTELRLTNQIYLDNSVSERSAQTGFALRSPSNLEIAASAVTVGTLRAFKKSLETPIAINNDNSIQTGTTISVGTQDESAESKFLGTLARGQIRGISMIREQATVADASNITVAFAINVIATKALEESLNLGLLNEANALDLLVTVTKTLTESLPNTILQDSAELAIPEVARSIVGLKKLPVAMITQASEKLANTLGNSINNNGLQQSSDAIFTKLVGKSIAASAEVSNSFDDFAKVAGSSAKAIFVTYTELNPITDVENAKSASNLIYGSSIEAIENVGEIPLANIEQVVLEIQKNASESFVNVSLTAEMRAPVLAETTKTIIGAVGNLTQVINSVEPPEAITAIFDKFAQVAVDEISSIAPSTATVFTDDLNVAAASKSAQVNEKKNNAQSILPSADDSSSTSNPSSADDYSSTSNPSSADDYSSTSNPSSADDYSSTSNPSSADDASSTSNPSSAVHSSSTSNPSSAVDSSSNSIGQLVQADQQGSLLVDFTPASLAKAKN